MKLEVTPGGGGRAGMMFVEFIVRNVRGGPKF